jgi:hypothetical protein
MHGEELHVRHALDATSRKFLNQDLQDFRQRVGIPADVQVPAGLCFDATPVSSTGIGRSLTLGSSFTFMLLPLDHWNPNSVIPSVWHENGKICHHTRER